MGQSPSQPGAPRAAAVSPRIPPRATTPPAATSPHLVEPKPEVYYHKGLSMDPKDSKKKRFNKKRPTTADSVESWTSVNSSASTIRQTSPSKFFKSLPTLLSLDEPEPRTVAPSQSATKLKSKAKSAPSKRPSGSNGSGRFGRKASQESIPPAIPPEWLQYRLQPEPSVDGWTDVDPPSPARLLPRRTSLRYSGSTILPSESDGPPTPTKSTFSVSSTRLPVGHPGNHHARFRRPSKTSPNDPSIKDRRVCSYNWDASLTAVPVRKGRRRSSRPSLHSPSTAGSSSSAVHLPHIQVGPRKLSPQPSVTSLSSEASFPRSVSSYNERRPSTPATRQIRLDSELSFISLYEGETPQLVAESTDDEEEEEEEEIGYPRARPPPTSEAMGWADYSLQSTPRNRSPVDSGVDVRMDADERDDVPRNDSIFSISSCDSAEDVELSHVLSQRGAESRYTVGTQRQYNSSEEMLVEFGQMAFSGTTFTQAPSLALEVPVVTPSLTLDDIVKSQESWSADTAPLVTPPNLPLPPYEDQDRSLLSPGNQPIPPSRFSWASSTSDLGLGASPTLAPIISAAMQTDRDTPTKRTGPLGFAGRERRPTETFDVRKPSLAGYFDEYESTYDANRGVESEASRLIEARKLLLPSFSSTTKIDFGPSFELPQTSTIEVTPSMGLKSKRAMGATLSHARMSSMEKRGFSTGEIKMWMIQQQ